jgi:hypothetical protein
MDSLALVVFLVVLPLCFGISVPLPFSAESRASRNGI